MNIPNNASQPPTSIKRKYPKLNHYAELSDTELAVIAGGLPTTCEDTKAPTDRVLTKNV